MKMSSARSFSFQEVKAIVVLARSSALELVTDNAQEGRRHCH